MPVHAHHGAERLEPERVSEAAQQFVATVMMNDSLTNYRAKVGHPVGEPPRDLPTVQRQVRGSSSLSHQSNVSRIRAAVVDRIWFTFAPLSRMS
jgi:hypothetical protein